MELFIFPLKKPKGKKRKPLLKAKRGQKKAKKPILPKRNPKQTARKRNKNQK